MTEEERRAIETLQYLCSDDCINKDIIKTIVNLIEKLQKENGELKENERYMKDVFGEQICTLKVDKERFKRYGIQKEEEIKELKSNSILKDKIREKIKELEQQKDLFFEKAVIQGRIDLLKELLEEE